MRILVVATSILIASHSVASAQFAMDHGNAAAAAQATRDARAAADAKAGAIARGGPLLPSQSTNFSVSGSGNFKVAPRRTPEQQKAFEEGQVAWTARCKPTVVEDGEKLRRVKYAQPDCDLSAYNTAGAD